MDTTVVYVLGIALLALGFIGCVVPVLPGPILGYAALWVPLLAGFPCDARPLWIGGAVTSAVTIADYVLPALLAKRFRCSRLGLLGCMVGTLVGLFFMPFGVVLGPFLGTVAGELVSGKRLCESLKGGVGAFLGFVTGVAMKFAAVGLFAWWFFTRV